MSVLELSMCKREGPNGWRAVENSFCRGTRLTEQGNLSLNQKVVCKFTDGNVLRESRRCSFTVLVLRCKNCLRKICISGEWVAPLVTTVVKKFQIECLHGN